MEHWHWSRISDMTKTPMDALLYLAWFWSSPTCVLCQVCSTQWVYQSFFAQQMPVAAGKEVDDSAKREAKQNAVDYKTKTMSNTEKS